MTTLKDEALKVVELVTDRNEAYGLIESRSPEYKGASLVLKAERLSDVGRRIIIDAPRAIDLSPGEIDTLQDTVAYCLEVLRSHTARLEEINNNKLPF